MNEENLKPIKLSHEEAVENGQKGGIARGENIKRRKTFQEVARELLKLKAPDEVVKKLREVFPEIPETLSVQDATTLMQMVKAAKGDTKAYEVIRDTAGDKPTDKQAFVDGEGGELKSPLIVFGQEIPKKEDVPAAPGS